MDCNIDCGAVADVWGGVSGEMTCKAPNSNVATRRDYIFACPKFRDLIKAVRVEENDDIPTHRPLRMEIDLGRIAWEVQRYRKAPSAADMVEERVQKEVQDQKEKTDSNQRQNSYTSN